jgi:DNA-binding LacI/PurR family transcriptional regulator
MVASDSMAVGAYEAAAEHGLSIPGDLSVASVDDIPEARALRPALTTARTSHVEFGLRATRHVLARVEARWRGDPEDRAGARTVPAREVIVPELVVRESAAPPAPRPAPHQE